MATSNRAAVFTKAHKVLKRVYKPAPHAERSVLEHILFACCLENAHLEQADKAFSALKSGFFDWNEVRVSTVKELAEVMSMLPDAMTAANNLRKVLFAIFESQYSYDLEPLKKLNLGVAQQKIQKYNGATPFVVGYVTQATLGGHCIPLDRGALQCLDVIVGLASKEKSEANVSGLERAIPKNKGIEFGSLLHEMGADMIASPMSTNLHKLLLEIAPDGKERLPKRQPPKKEEPPKPAPRAAVVEKGKPAAAAPKKPTAPEPAKSTSKAPAPAKPAPKKEPAKEPSKKPSTVLQKRKPK